MSREKKKGTWKRQGKEEERWEYQDVKGAKKGKGEEREVKNDDETGDQSWCVFQSELSLILWKGAVV